MCVIEKKVMDGIADGVKSELRGQSFRPAASLCAVDKDQGTSTFHRQQQKPETWHNMRIEYVELMS
jgi:hypothetical protein